MTKILLDAIMLGGLLPAFLVPPVFSLLVDATAAAAADDEEIIIDVEIPPGGIPYGSDEYMKFFEPLEVDFDEDETSHMGVGRGDENDAYAAARGLLQDDYADMLFEEERRYKQAQKEQKKKVFPYRHIAPMQRSTPPRLCSDGRTTGYSDLNSLRLALREANEYSDESFIALSQYYAAYEKYERDPRSHEEPIPPGISLPDPFVLCPGILKSRRATPIEINAEDVTLVCDSCIIDAPGTHIAFGPKARNVLVKGVTFTGATTSSLTFFHHGSRAEFEDCFWKGNTGTSPSVGAIADLNSTSSVSFYRCEISDRNQITRVGGQMKQGSSLTIRN